MNTVINYESIFGRYGGIMRTCELIREGISYQMLRNLIEQGKVVTAFKPYGLYGIYHAIASVFIDFRKKNAHNVLFLYLLYK